MSQAVNQKPTRKPRKLNLNMGIAQTHQVATQLVGIQLSGSNLLAIAVSAASVVAGTVTLAVQRYPDAWPLWIAAGVIGVGLAFLIEGMTLGALIRIRIANKHIREIEEKMEATRTFRPGFHPIEAFFFWQKKRNATRLHRRGRSYSIPLACIGALASSCAGGLFYHTILVGLGTWESLGLAALFALIVTGTFVSSEIFKEVQEKAIKEGFEGGSITEAAIRQETKRLAVLAVHEKIIAYLDKDEAQAETEKEAKNILHDIIQELRTTTGDRALPEPSIPGQVIVQMESGAPEAITNSTKQIEQNKEQQSKEEAKELETAESTISAEQAASQTEQDAVTKWAKEIFTSLENENAREASSDKLKRTLQFLNDHPQLAAAWTDEDDAQLADYLGLPRPANARFWRLKALEVWHPQRTESTSTITQSFDFENFASLEQDHRINTEPLTSPRHKRVTPGLGLSAARYPAEDTQSTGSIDNLQRITEYLATHPDATQQEVADALSLSIRTVQRRLSSVKDGQATATGKLKIIQ